MAAENDARAVIDRLRFKELNGLRQIDAGFIPKIVSENTNAAAIMIGERGADFIKADWNYTSLVRFEENSIENCRANNCFFD